MTKPEAIQNNNTSTTGWPNFPNNLQMGRSVSKTLHRLRRIPACWPSEQVTRRWANKYERKKRQQKQVTLTLLIANAFLSNKLDHWDTVLLCCRKHTNRMRWFDQFICILHILEQYVAWKINAYITYNTTQNQSQTIYTENIKKKIRLNL